MSIGNNGEQQREAFFLYVRHRMSGFSDSWQRWPRGDVEHYPLLEQQMAQMLAAREAVGNYQPPKGDWRSVSVQELIAQERQRSLLWRPQRFWVGARSTFGEDRA
ncbi:MAG: hypothetical protein WBX30_19840, partial [Stellaceae bacterium]